MLLIDVVLNLCGCWFNVLTGVFVFGVIIVANDAGGSSVDDVDFDSPIQPLFFSLHVGNARH